MKVICIDDSWTADTMPTANPKTGEVVTETSRYKCGCCGQEVITLSEYGHGFAYTASYFIPLSDIDETEMVREYKKQTV